MIIRVAKPEDAVALLEIYAPYVEQTAVTFEYEVPTVESFAGRIEQTLKKYPYLVAEIRGEIVGYAYAGAFHDRPAYAWSVETSIYIRKNRRRLGIGRKLYEELERILKLQNIVNVNACIAYPEMEDEYLTQDSVKFHEQCGYQMVGMFKKSGYKFKRWYHMVWMDKCIGEHRAEQPPMLPFPEIAQGCHLPLS